MWNSSSSKIVKASLFCAALDTACSADCNANGRCLSDRTCNCFYFYQGTSCETKNECTIDTQSICESLKSVDKNSGTNEDDSSVFDFFNDLFGRQTKLETFFTAVLLLLLI